MTKLNSKTTDLILVLAYLVLPLAIPNIRALDSIGPRFLAIGILNLLSLIILFARSKKEDRHNQIQRFWGGLIGITYTLFIGFSILSCVNSINLNESLIYLTRLFTILVSTFVLFQLISTNKKFIVVIAIGLSAFLIIDSIALLYGIRQYIVGTIEAISDINFIYSNKNILASAIFVKLAAAVWLMFFEKGWYRISGYFAAFLGMLSIFLLSSRTFYLGLIVILIALGIFVLTRSISLKKKTYIKPFISYIALLAISLSLFSLTQKHLYPKEPGVLNKDVITRISTITDSNANLKRLDSWKRTIKLIGEHPMLGVGTGNWKLSVLEYENRELPDFKFMYKNHNDFLEVTAETGLLGGFSYLAIFILILLSFIRQFFKPGIDSDKLKYMAFPAIGILAYSIDAFFNFPANRASMQLLFALFVASGAAFSDFSFKKIGKSSKGIARTLPLLLIVLTISSLYLLNLNLKSLSIQRLVKEDNLANQYSASTARMIAKYPTIPNINCVGGPIVIDKVRYLIDEEEFDEAKKLLNNDHSSPFDYRKDYYLGMILAQQGKIDSALIVLEKFHENKPLFQLGIDMYSTVLHEASRKAYTNKEYQKTLDHTAKLLTLRPDYIQINPIRAYCLFFTQQYSKCLELLNQIISHGSATDDLLQLKEECVKLLGS